MLWLVGAIRPRGGSGPGWLYQVEPPAFAVLATTELVGHTGIPGYPEQEIAYNMRLLSEAGYIKANILDSSSGDGRIVAASARRLTNSGHDLLDTIRAESVWGKVKDTFKAKGIEMTVDLVIAVGKEVAKSVLLS